MYDLAPRFKKATSSATPDNLGPNNYTICDKNYTLKNRTPFLSTAKRKGPSLQPVYTDTLYNLNDVAGPKIKGGSSLKCKQPRFQNKEDETPGPGDHNPKLQKRGCKCPLPPQHGTGKLYVCRVPYSVWCSAPSVPTHIDANGYDIDESGDIVKVPLDDIDKTLGPAYYNVPVGEPFFTTRRYHMGNQWSKSKTKRWVSTKDMTPAPGDYDIPSNLCRTDQKAEEYRELARLFSFMPRYTEQQMLRMSKEDLPGPGHYDAKVPKCRAANALSVNPVPFISGETRFKATTSDVPGPGKYEPDSSGNKRFYNTGAPFLCAANRFRPRKEDESPSPATYALKGCIDEMLKRKYPTYSSVDAPFLSTTERKMGFVSDDVYNLPGPGEYDVEDASKEKKCLDTSVFKAITSRFPKKRTVDRGGLYDVSEDFKRLKERTSHNKGKVGFMSVSKREGPCSSVKRVTPSPADYIGQGEMYNGRGLKFSTIERFPYRCDDAPPPGSYNVHPSRALSLYRAVATHNLRLKENVARTKLRLAPKDTKDRWNAEKEKRKKLRWFVGPTDEYRHCQPD